MSFDEKKVAIEQLEREQTMPDEIVELHGIEATATSQAAWLIAITVSIGGFLFGQQHSHHCNIPR
jgi:MFS transporter, SP family, solute carrier family 2 (myo-inositol transporter), member 13